MQAELTVRTYVGPRIEQASNPWMYGEWQVFADERSKLVARSFDKARQVVLWGYDPFLVQEELSLATVAYRLGWGAA